MSDVPTVHSPVALAVALLSVAAGAWLALNHPIAPTTTTVAFLLWTAIVYRRPGVALFALPALLPLVDAATWSGWIVFEEFDILVLGAIGGGYGALAFGGWPSAVNDSEQASISTTSRLLIMLFGASVGVSLLVGWFSAGRASAGWFADYYDPLNSLRIAKPFAFAALMALPLRAEIRRSGARAIDWLMMGYVMGLAFASLSVLWERIAFIGLFDLSADYRTTGPFWEMHVGGAALDGFLALTIPFAIREWLCARTIGRSAAVGGVIALASYAGLSTFSRGLYVAVPLSFAVLIVMLMAQTRTASSRTSARTVVLRITLLIVVTLAASWLAFRHGGYRTLAAVVGLIGIGVPLAAHLRARSIGRGVIAGFFCGGVVAVVEVLALLGAAVATVGVALYWGGVDAGLETSIAVTLILLLLIGGAVAASPPWLDDLRSQLSAVGAAILIAVAVAVSGGPYMENRLAASPLDFDRRISHWQHGIRMLQTLEDWSIGKGLGRFPSNHLDDVGSKVPGFRQLGSEGGERYLVLYGPPHGTSGDDFRVSQRIPAISGVNWTVTLRARTSSDAVLQLEICEKHLIYDGACAVHIVMLKGDPTRWQHIAASLDGREIVGGVWYAPRLSFFSMVAGTIGGRIDIDDVAVSVPGGQNVIDNGEFSDGLGRWFFTSDRDHLPWHVLNLPLGVLLDQGIVGLTFFVALVGAALVRTLVVARRHPAAPYIASALTAFLAVGMFDSLLDVPRVAFLFYVVVLVALVLPRDDASLDRRGKHVVSHTTAPPVGLRSSARRIM